MSDPALGLTMLALIVVVIMMGFPTAFTLMGLGMFFGYIAFYDPTQAFTENKVFDLMVQRTYGAMTNDVLISIPLFVLMGYVMERGALVDKMFYSIQLAFRRVPAALAVATLIVCTFWGIASGLVGAVVVLMGVIAFNPMLRAGYDVKLASGVITAGGTLGILIPPSVMIIVYAAVAGQSVVKLYAAAMFPGFFLSLLYLIYIVGWAMINPKIAPELPEEQTKVPVPDWVRKFQAAYSSNMLLALGQSLVSPARARVIEVDSRPLGYAGRARPARGFLSLVQLGVRRHARGAGALLLAHGRRPLRGAQAAHLVGDAARHPHGGGARRHPVRHHHRDRVGRGRRRRRLPARHPGEDARLEAHEGSRVPHRQDHRHGVLAVRRLGAVLRRVRHPGRAGAGRAVGAVAEHDADPVHDPVTGDHLRPRLAARVDRDHRELRADLPAAAAALQHRPDPVGHDRVREPASGVPVAAGGDVGVLSQGRVAAARHAQPDIRRHDAVHADRHHLHGDHVSVARHDAVAAQLSLRRRLSRAVVTAGRRTAARRTHLLQARSGVLSIAPRGRA